jgi:putative ABC transport system ATP-binding protein
LTIEAENLVKIYKADGVETLALQGISMKVGRGDFVSIVGPSGCGKSTLLNMLGTLDRPTSGKVLIDGVDTSALSDTELAKIRNEKIGFVFQSFNLIPRMNALMNVELPLLVMGVPRDERRERALRWLKEMGISEKSHNRPSQLSGGEQQRLAVARSLVTDPSIILADEPTGNLDSKNSIMVVELLKQLNESTGKTLIIITHDLDVAKHTRRIIHLRDGQIEKEEIQ